MSRPPINPAKSNAGIIMDPQTLERVIPESRRPDGSVRKQIKVRPGFTPQEDVKRFRGSKQAQMDANRPTEGHIIGWAPPSSASQPAKPLSNSAKKNAKRKERREKKRENTTVQERVRDDWEDDDDDAVEPEAPVSKPTPPAVDAPKTETSSEHTADKPSGTTVVSSEALQKLTTDLEKLNVK